MKYRESLNIVNKDLQLPAILAINSSINAEESLSRVFEVLQDFLDADGAFVNIFDVQKHSIVFVAHCRRNGLSSPLGSVEPPRSLRPLKITDKVLNCSDISEDRFTQKVLSECLPDVKSYLMLSMDKEDRHLGVVCFYSRRYDQFNEAQRNLLKSLHDSFSLMTSNALNSVLLANNRDLIHENDGLKDCVRESRMALVNRFTARTPSLKEITAKVEKVSSTEVPMYFLAMYAPFFFLSLFWILFIEGQSFSFHGVNSFKNVPGTIVVSMIYAFAITSLGLLIAAFLKRYRFVVQIVVPSSIPFVFISGNLYPWQNIPWPLQAFGWLSPTTAGAFAMLRVSQAGASLSGVAFPYLTHLLLLGATFLTGAYILIYKTQNDPQSLAEMEDLRNGVVDEKLAPELTPKQEKELTGKAV